MLEEKFDTSVVTNMTTTAPKTKFALAKKYLLALPFLALLAVMMPSAAQADEHHGYYHRHGYYRHHYYHHRHYYYRHGHRYYGYGPGYYGPGPGVSVNVGL